MSQIIIIIIIEGKREGIHGEKRGIAANLQMTCEEGPSGFRWDTEPTLPGKAAENCTHTSRGRLW